LAIKDAPRRWSRST